MLEHLPARPIFILAVAVGVLATLARPAAQLLPSNERGMAMGHVLLNVDDVDAHRNFWVTQFDAKPITVGRLSGVSVPGVAVLFRPQHRTGPAEGTTINHMGLKLRKLADYTARFDKGGYKYDPPRIGREKTPQTYVTGPDTFRMELVEDPRLPAPVVSHHLHYWLERPADVKKWYVEKLQLLGTMRGPYDSGDVPGMNLTFAPLGRQKEPGEATKGRLMDSIGFEVRNLEAYVKSLQANGARVDIPYGRDGELGVMSATLTDPWGVTIRLTEGLIKAAGVTTYSYTDGYVVTKAIE
jgi:hypothetical protein